MYCLLNVLYCVLIRGLGKIGYTKRATLLKKLLTYSLVLQDTVIDETVVMNQTYVVSRDMSDHGDQENGDATTSGTSFDISHRDVDDTEPIEEQ